MALLFHSGSAVNHDSEHSCTLSKIWNWMWNAVIINIISYTCSSLCHTLECHEKGLNMHQEASTNPGLQNNTNAN